MSLTLEIITSAYRESNLTAIGAALTTDQTAEALQRLNVLVSSAYGNEVGDPLHDWPVGVEGRNDNTSWSSEDWAYVLANSRLVASSTTAQTVYLPPEPDDGARVAIVDPGNRLAAAPITVNGNGRPIEGATSVVINTNGATRTWFYRADLGKWVLLSDLTASGGEEFPFPKEFDDYFITKLAMRLNPRYGRALGETTVAALETSLRQLRARYRQNYAVACDAGVLATTRGIGGASGVGRSVRGRMSWMN